MKIKKLIPNLGKTIKNSMKKIYFNLKKNTFSFPNRSLDAIFIKSGLFSKFSHFFLRPLNSSGIKIVASSNKLTPSGDLFRLSS